MTFAPILFDEFPLKPGLNDISIYLRCATTHYYWNSAEYFDAILSRLEYQKIWLFLAPNCALFHPITKIQLPRPKVDRVIDHLLTKYNAIKWPSAANGSSEDTILLHDLAGLAQSNRIILPKSSWATWAGMLSNATEVHLNAPPISPVMPSFPQFVYHSEGKKLYFGHWNQTSRQLEYQYDDNNNTHVLQRQ